MKKNTLTRNEERAIAFEVIYESLFHADKSVSEICEIAVASRDIPRSSYIQSIVACVDAHLEYIQGKIDEYAVGWKRNRISKVSLAVLTLAAAEIFFVADIPLRVSLNEAIELSKKFDDEKAYGFVNGVLNAMVHDKDAVEEK